MVFVSEGLWRRGGVAVDETEFRAFFTAAEPRLRRALVATYGPERGREGAAEALAFAWEHWDELRSMDNAIGYLYRVGQSRTRSRKTRAVFGRSDASEPWVEPGLGAALARLSERQRVAVVLVHGFGWSLREVAELTGTATTTVENHVERGLARLRTALEVLDA
jgi:DNA-directed RNA polymerase specialized sigma24 family protein